MGTETRTCHTARLVASALVVALAAGGCTGGDRTTSPRPRTRPAHPTSTTQPPTPAAARFEGQFDVTYTLETTLGLQPEELRLAAGQIDARVWTATPRCDTGACDVAVKSLNLTTGGTVDTVLSRSDGVYRTTTPSPESSTCGSGLDQVPGAYDASITIEVQVVSLEVVDGTPVVKEMTGTKVDDVKATPAGDARGCRPFSVRWQARVLRRAADAGPPTTPTTTTTTTTTTSTTLRRRRPSTTTTTATTAPPETVPPETSPPPPDTAPTTAPPGRPGGRPGAAGPAWLRPSSVSAAG